MQLKECTTVQELQNYVGNLQAKEIGFWGGRRFAAQGQSDDVSLNDVIQKTESIFSTAEKPTKHKDQFSEIYVTITELDQAGNKKLESASLIAKLFTWIRSHLSYLFYNQAAHLAKLDLSVNALQDPIPQFPALT